MDNIQNLQIALAVSLGLVVIFAIMLVSLYFSFVEMKANYGSLQKGLDESFEDTEEKSKLILELEEEVKDLRIAALDATEANNKLAEAHETLKLEQATNEIIIAELKAKVKVLQKENSKLLKAASDDITVNITEAKPNRGRKKS